MSSSFQQQQQQQHQRPVSMAGPGDPLLPVAPLVLHTPPQIFRPSEGPRSDSTMSDPLLGLDDFAFLSDEGAMDAKRRRIARACDMCRKKKIKCDGQLPACSHCINYKTECIFTHVEKKRNPPKGAKYVEGLENRLNRMESLLKLSGVLAEDDDGKTDLKMLEKQLAGKAAKKGSSPSKPASQRGSVAVASSADSYHDDASTPPSAFETPDTTATPAEAEKRDEEEVEALSDMMSTLVTNSSGETRYIGSSSGFSIFSPRGIQWVCEKTGDSSFQEMIGAAAMNDSKWMHWKPEVFEDLFARRAFVPLPAKDEALSLLRDFFENFNCMFPLFHEPTFMHLVDLHYAQDPYEGSGWWASLNVALAIAHRLRVMSKLVSPDEDQKAWGYLKNALGLVTELTMRNTDLFSVQALLGMALFLQGTPNPQPSFSLVAAAIRLAHSIGLHRRGSGFHLRPEEIEQRKRVFWIAYLVDKDLSLRSGRPPAQDDDDMNVELPSEDPPDNIGNIPLGDGQGKVNLFRLMCTFAVIESKVYTQLYAVKASRQSDGELLQTIGRLDRELEDWKNGIPIDFRPEYEIKASHTPLILHVVTLHFAYYNCLTTIHRMSIHHGYWSSRLSDYAIKGLNARPLNPRVYSSAALCVAAARASISLLPAIPPGDCACVWLVLYFPVSALVTLFANILQHPHDGRARSDVRLMNRVVAFLSTLCHDEQNGGLKQTLAFCAEFERIARAVIDKAADDASPRHKRKSIPAEPSSAAADPRPSSSPRSPLPLPLPLRATSASASASAPAPASAPLFTPAPSAERDSPAAHPHAPPEAAASLLTPAASFPAAFADAAPDLPAFGALMNLDAFPQPPFVPQDLWQMPMSLDWDWTDMTAYDGSVLFAAGGGAHVL
ncbi:MAG: hypothetical protein M1826_007463 [Phylliscum demangeonii]|nr:MAG: hypothetical protein M1826_007463 [Phylliscum demangeonii]